MANPAYTVKYLYHHTTSGITVYKESCEYSMLPTAGSNFNILQSDNALLKSYAKPIVQVQSLPLSALPFSLGLLVMYMSQKELHIWLPQFFWHVYADCRPATTWAFWSTYLGARRAFSRWHNSCCAPFPAQKLCLCIESIMPGVPLIGYSDTSHETKQRS